MATRKKSRKELLKKPDEFITLTGKAIRFVSKYQKPISYALCAGVAIVLVIFGYRFFAQRVEAKAFSLLEQTMAKYEAQKKATSPNEAYKKVSEEFQRIVEKYGEERADRIMGVMLKNYTRLVYIDTGLRDQEKYRTKHYDG